MTYSFTLPRSDGGGPLTQQPLAHTKVHTHYTLTKARHAVQVLSFILLSLAHSLPIRPPHSPRIDSTAAKREMGRKTLPPSAYRITLSLLFARTRRALHALLVSLLCLSYKGP